MSFIDNARYEMESVVQRLYEIDPFWQKCNPCTSCGYCCKGANPNFSIQEVQEIIENCIFTDEEKEKLKSNLFWKKKCPFRFSDRCLVHEYRSLNCRWTPYQVAVDDENIVRYYPIINSCKFNLAKQKKDKLNFKVFEGHYVWLPHLDGSKHCHILLNSLEFIRNYKWDIPATDVAKLILKKQG